MKNIIVTGASGCIGSEISRALAEDGSRLFLIGHKSIDFLEGLKEKIESCFNSSVYTFSCDLSDEDEVDSLFEEIFKISKGIDILVNNAGISYIGLLQDMKISDWDRVIDTNLRSIFLMSRKVIPSMVANKSGKIINISSIWGSYGASCEVCYSASKGAINSFSKALAKELAPSNIQVNAISFGVIDSKMNIFLNDDEKKVLTEEIPASRFGLPSECGKMVKLISQSPEYLTGQIITLDGGLF